MKITKLGHCCLLIEEKNLRIVTDPGSWTIEEQSQLENIDIIVITHEHGDHLHIESLKEILQKSPHARIITNQSVGRLLVAENISFIVIEHGDVYNEDVHIQGYGEKHAEIYKDMGQVQNTGYFIAEKLFYPGDAFYNPGVPVDVLALPVAGPWTDIKTAVEYAIEIQPKKAFPVHDGMLKSFGSNHRAPLKFLPENNIEFIALQNGDSIQV
jgi:L-ascorbate metabolism protein UlaG (beta-lactamase superfamily)